MCDENNTTPASDARRHRALEPAGAPPSGEAPQRWSHGHDSGDAPMEHGPSGRTLVNHKVAQLEAANATMRESLLIARTRAADAEEQLAEESTFLRSELAATKAALRASENRREALRKQIDADARIDALRKMQLAEESTLLRSELAATKAALRVSENRREALRKQIDADAMIDALRKTHAQIGEYLNRATHISPYDFKVPG